ncbi:hypothetical protein EJ05DRAFT_477954 [Pseudovirgaria hyperparasitica]|uniref:Maintenance of mitochondrial morphology protein 1 n=1 Tax=Pseudovirgaria hyperparasitica TaxID=470096 RepID=A0A6A6W1T0_9PEZI|nr:uncharacterized protein EJ05DRAFT_477954 [Pseudovirgaria hyperparasitica]KAF2755890.1 hypothetical protein EJ05DRAFT_477954 [Pseudovirgaria hyperparasitica]
MAGSVEPPQTQASSLSFTQGFLVGQLSIVALIIFFIKFFIFGELPPADERAFHLSSLRRQRTLAHQRTASVSLRRKASSVLRNPPAPLTAASILAKTYYNVHGHQPESLDWFNVLIAQTLAQLRADARQDDAVVTSLTKVMNGPGKPDFVGDIKITEIALGDEFPIFSNCRVIPVEEGGLGSSLDGAGGEGGRLQARMDVDLSDVITLGVETTLRLNYPKPLVAVLPVALAVSVVRFSGTLALSFIPSSPAPESDLPYTPTNSAHPPHKPTSQTPYQTQSDPNSARPPTTLAFTFLDDYRLDLSVRSLVGSRSRLQDVPKIAQLVESRIHAWFDERVVEPRFQQIILPNLWPRKKNTRGGADDDELAVEDDLDELGTPLGKGTPRTRGRRRSSAALRRRGTAESGAQTGFAERMEAEGQRLREAEERAGIRPRAAGSGHERTRDRSSDLRYRSRPGPSVNVTSSRDAAEWAMPGPMPSGI